MTTIHTLAALLPLLAACAASGTTSADGGAPPSSADVPAHGGAHAVEASAPNAAPDATSNPTSNDASNEVTGAGTRAAASDGTTAPAARPLDAPTLSSELSIWQDPEFQRRFNESYLAEAEIEPSVTADEHEVLQKVVALMGEEQTQKALELLRKNASPASSAVFDFLEASLAFQTEDFERAERGYLRAIEKYPKFRRAWKILGFIHARRDEFAAAARAFTRVIALGENTPEVYGLLGVAYSNLEDHLAAESAYRMAILLDPGSRDWKMGLATSLFRQKRFADAVALFDTLIGADPDEARLWLLQANAYIGLERPLQAAQGFEMVDALGAATPASLTNLGDIYVTEGLFDVAVERYLRALDDEALAPDRALRAARVMIGQSAFDATRTLLDGVEARRAGTLEEKAQKDLLDLRARVALAEGAGDEEARILQAIVALDPLDGDALIRLGQHAERSGDTEQAVFYFERAESIEASEADACVRHAQLLVREKQYSEALGLLGRAQRLRPRETIQEYIEQVERVAQKR